MVKEIKYKLHVRTFTYYKIEQTQTLRGTYTIQKHNNYSSFILTYSALLYTAQLMYVDSDQFTSTAEKK